MARDYAKTRSKTNSRKKTAARSGNSRGPTNRGGEGSGGSAWRWYFAGLLSGLFLSFILYLGALPPGADKTVVVATATPETTTSQPPKPRFDFYTMLPEQNIDLDVEPATEANPRNPAATETYLLQAGSFRQREDADRRRAELLLLGLSPKVEETNSDNGRWFRVYLGPFSSHQGMARARSLTAGQDIDTLLLKRGSP